MTLTRDDQVDVALSTRYFFFQAEDGIRDGHVTGVQTCALPIWWRPPRGSARSRPGPGSCPPAAAAAASRNRQEIGRASCRERAQTAEADGEVTKKMEEEIAKKLRTGNERTATMPGTKQNTTGY